MLEQQKQASQVSASTEKHTELEGIRQKVFMDRYSLKDPSGQPLEFYPEQLWARVARGIAAVETTEEKQAYWEKRFNEALADFQFVPGGRILAGAGSGHQVTFYNCMPPEQESADSRWLSTNFRNQNWRPYGDTPQSSASSIA